MNRREFLQTTVASAALLTTLSPAAALAADAPSFPLKGRLFKSLKIGMVNVPGSLTDKFKVVKEVGFHGIEMDAPGMNVEETKKAVAESGLPVDGTVCSTHWNVRHSDKDPAVRAKALENLLSALRDTKAVGGSTVLLVLGHGKDGTEQEVWERSMANVRKALPLAAELGVSILLENVWNSFLYQHDGPENQGPEKFIKYVDEVNSPWFGVHFDIGNHQKYAKPADWIRALGRRIAKLDVKDWGKKAGWAKIGEGDIDWPEVRKALTEINYHGWAAAEVSGGGRDGLKTVSEQMDKVFGLA